MLNSVENKARDFPLGLSIYLRKLVFSHTLWNVFLRNAISLRQVCALRALGAMPLTCNCQARAPHPPASVERRSYTSVLQTAQVFLSYRRACPFHPSESRSAKEVVAPLTREIHREPHVTNSAVWFSEDHLPFIWEHVYSDCTCLAAQKGLCATFVFATLAKCLWWSSAF